MGTLEELPLAIRVRVVLEVPVDLLAEAIKESKEIKFLQAVLDGVLGEFGVRVTKIWFPHKATLAEIRDILDHAEAPLD